MNSGSCDWVYEEISSGMLSPMASSCSRGQYFTLQSIEFDLFMYMYMGGCIQVSPVFVLVSPHCYSIVLYEDFKHRK